MLSFAFSIVSMFLFSPLFWLGYAVCVLFPIPYINTFVISLWSKFGSQIMALWHKLTGSAEVSVADAVGNTVVDAVESAISTAVANTIANTAAMAGAKTSTKS